MNQALDFQTMILKLQRYWTDHGCLLWQPYYTQVGAGTMNPATFLRVLGPEAWNVVYVEPSIRPDDGRYGENPNRMQQHYQLQVILKPDPGNPQELYLKSLEAIGIDPLDHDIRFVEDNWESPALGAWGLGWEVWLDGQEITQFTYFQQAGGMPVNPVAVEITYGLERIIMALQKVRSFRDIQWNDQRTYGDVNLQGEQEHSKYYFETANVDRLREMYELYEQEARAALADGMVLPAHDYVLKCSHTFNILDTRGAVGVTERQALFSNMRDLARQVAEQYVAQRESLEYPWLAETAEPETTMESPDVEVVIPDTPQSFLFELGTEELPVADLAAAVDYLENTVPALLAELRLEHKDVKILGTPRRLVVFVDGLATQQPNRELVVKGPPANRAFDDNGQPTKAAIGFARGKGVDVNDLQVREIDGGEYVAAVVFEEGQSTYDVLRAALPELISKIHFGKAMRWNDDKLAFSRPIRWLLALFGDQVIPFEYAGLNSARQTRGLRFIQPEQFEVNNPADYFDKLANQGIILDPQIRKNSIADQVLQQIEELGGVAEISEDLLDEVSALVEAPTAFIGKFEEEYLQLPPEVLISVMKKHQRYFPVQNPDGGLLPYFIGVRNGDGQHLDIVSDGNEQVIRARFADAAFFIKEDAQDTLEDLRSKLSTLTFQFKLGSMLDKSDRITKTVEQFSEMFDLEQAERETVKRAAFLSKSDLMSHMVVEMTSLQGIMGLYYARRDGESEAVAKAIFEHYLPRFAGDRTPEGCSGLVVGLADRLDSIAGLFAAGLAPSGTKDPFGLRRSALGLVQNLIAWDVDFDLLRGLQIAAATLPIDVEENILDECLTFIVGRMRNLLIEQGFRYDVVDAVLEVQKTNPAGVLRAVQELSEWVDRADWNEILPAYSRCVRITRDQKEQFTINPERFELAQETDLYQALEEAEKIERQAGSVADFFKVFVPMISKINHFFDEVLVMADDAVVKANRLGLLQRLAAMTNDVADFSKLEGF
jgi:glycyl-tRNA synthetase